MKTRSFLLKMISAFTAAALLLQTCWTDIYAAENIPAVLQAYDGVYNMEEYYQDIYQDYHDLFEEDSSFMLQYLLEDKYHTYIQFSNRMQADEKIQKTFDITLNLMNLGSFFDLINNPEDRAPAAREEYYIIALYSLFQTMSDNLSDAINNQAKADQTMKWNDYAWEILQTGADVYGSQLSVPAVDKTEALKKITGAMSSACGLMSFDIDLINALSDEEYTEENYNQITATMDIYKSVSDVLEVLVIYGDGELKSAAQKILDMLGCSLMYRLQRGSDFWSKCREDVMDFVFGDFMDALSDNVGGSLIEGISDEEFDTLTFGFNSVKNLLDSFHAGTELGILFCDLTIGGSDIFLRYFEMCAMADVRKCMLQRVEGIRSKIHGPEDHEAIWEFARWADNLLYVDARGEYCMHSLLTKDAKLFSLIGKAFKGDQFESSYKSGCQIVKNIHNELAFGLVRDPELYKYTWEEWEQVYGSKPDTIYAGKSLYIPVEDEGFWEIQFTEDMSCIFLSEAGYWGEGVKQNLYWEFSIANDMLNRYEDPDREATIQLETSEKQAEITFLEVNDDYARGRVRNGDKLVFLIDNTTIPKSHQEYLASSTEVDSYSEERENSLPDGMYITRLCINDPGMQKEREENDEGALTSYSINGNMSIFNASWEYYSDYTSPSQFILHGETILYVDDRTNYYYLDEELNYQEFWGNFEEYTPWLDVVIQDGRVLSMGFGQ